MSNNFGFRDVMIAACDADRRVTNVSNQLFTLAQKASSLDDFLAGCEDAEGYILSEQAGSNRWQGELPRCWVQTKSNIKAGIKLGLNPSDFKTATAFKDAKVKVNKQRTDANVHQIGALEREPGATNPEPQGTDVKLADLPMIPDDLTDMLRFMQPLPELTRAKLVKSFTAQAKKAYDTHKSNQKEGQRRLEKQAATS